MLTHRGPLVLAAGLVCFALANSGSEPAQSRLLAVSSPERPVDLGACPDLRRGQSDPANGRNCVQALQLALRRGGYPDQPVTGRFLQRTENNVRDFQRRQGIRPFSGIAGPLTRTALSRGLGSGTERPRVVHADYSSRSYCDALACRLYLRRTTTRNVAGWLDEHPASGVIASNALVTAACGALKAHRAVKIICGLFVDSASGRVVDQLKEAARQRACLRVSIGLHVDRTGPRLIDATPDSSARCME